MEHQQWQDLIPFYIAQTLAPPQQQVFEQHLSQCAHCQQEISDWRMIASAVWVDAETVSRSLPPLSQEVYNRLQYRNRPPVNQYAANPPRPAYAATAQGLPRRRRVSRKVNFFMPITLVAGLVTALLFGGLLILLAMNLPLRDDDEGQINIAMNLTAIDETVTFASANTQRDVTPTNDPLEQTILPTLTPRASAQLPPTSTAMPAKLPATQQVQANSLQQVSATRTPLTLPDIQPEIATGIGGGGDSSDVEDVNNAMMAQMALPQEGAGPYITLTPNITQDGTHVCYLFNPTGEGLTLYTAASFDSDVAGILQVGEEYRTLVRSNNGWYEIALQVRSGRYLVAWMPPQTAYLRGNCSADVFWIPSPTPTNNAIEVQATPTIIRVTDGMTATITPATANLYATANRSNPVATANAGDTFTIVGSTGVGTDQLLQVRYSDERLLWLFASDVIIQTGR